VQRVLLEAQGEQRCDQSRFAEVAAPVQIAAPRFVDSRRRRRW
jgi:hypothetical protein